MLEKWKQKALQMNLKKAAIFFIVTSLVLIIASFAAVYGNFQGRMNEWENIPRQTGGMMREKRTLMMRRDPIFQTGNMTRI